MYDTVPTRSTTAPAVSSTVGLQKNKNVYYDELAGFSFEYPTGYRVTGFDDFGGRVVLVKNPTKDLAVQLFVSERTNPAPVSLSEIKSVAGMKVGGSKEVLVGKEQLPAIAFESKSSDGVVTQEVWFARKGLLYQVSAYRTDAPLLPILNSLMWE